jgi:hypothetical protein
MTSPLMTLDYEHLAAGELERAALCQADDCRTRHLNRAAVYAHRAEKAGPGATQPGEVLNLIGALSTALDEADGLGLTMVALHIDRAVIDLGGIGRGPPGTDASGSRLG